MPERFFIQPMHVEHIPAVGAIERLCFSQPWPAHAYRREIQNNRMAYYEVARVAFDPQEDSGQRSAVSGRRADDGRPEAPRPALRTPHSAPSPDRSQPGLLGRLSRLLKLDEPLSPELEAELRSIVGYAGLWLTSDEAHVTTIAVHPEFQGRGVGELLLVGLIDHAVTVSARALTLEVRASNEVAQALYRKYTFKEVGVRKAYYSDNREDAVVMWTDPLDSDSFREAVQHNRTRLAQRLGDMSHEP